MSYPINYPTPQGANVQIFREGGTTSDWVKPQGASFVWFTLIGAGGGGGGADGTSAGAGAGSGAVTNCMVPAFLIPDVLQVNVGLGGKGGALGGGNGFSGSASTVVYQQKDNSGYTLLNANGGVRGTGSSGVAGTGGAADSSNYFSCIGFFQSIAGQNGTSATAQTASATTFLGGGSAGNYATATANYGYSVSNVASTGSGAPSQLQPIIVSCGGAGGTIGSPDPKGQKAGFGSGGGGGYSNAATYVGGDGGDGLIVIITW